MSQTVPVAITGMGCRLPGADTPEQLWLLLAGKTDAVAAAAPVGRADVAGLYDPVPRAPGRLVSLAGGYLDDLTRFDPGRYALTDREAAALDPQHKVLLATAADALAHAGIDPGRLAGSDTGVFMGQSTGEHWDTGRGSGPADMYAIAGGAARSMASGRISYAWDLRGPCATTDAACSSGALAVHLACQALRAGECDIALAGGVSLVLGVDHTLGYSAAGMLAPSGRCRFADESADGFIRADGCGVLVLKPLAQAVTSGDRIHAIILASAQASKGRTAKAIIAPSVEGYQQVISRAAASAGISPGDIGYIEAHGNGTPAGDAIELQAIGAVKTNIGHPEAAGGVAGIIKTALALRHRQIPASLHCPQPTAAVNWVGLGITPVTEHTTWPYAGPAIAGVNTYGLSGTFVHILLSQHVTR
jgi:3-oxoacyl-[acyl-carrier-protein] synthase II